MKLANSKLAKVVAVYLGLNLMFQLISPTLVMALTSGPSVPEVQSFEPVNTTQMVDLFTGDFTYNIPLFNLPGPNGSYPFNMAYHAGIGMDQEASMVGLGWNLNPGAIMRNVRGLPDDFKGDVVKTKDDAKVNETYGTSAAFNLEAVGADLNKPAWMPQLTTYYNSYKGVGHSLSVSVSQSVNQNVGFGGSVTLDSEDGASANANIQASNSKVSSSKSRYDLGFSSERGLNMSITGASNERMLSLGFSENVHYPAISQQTITLSHSGVAKAGSEAAYAFPNGQYSFFFNREALAYKGINVERAAYGYNHLHEAEIDRNILRDFSREKDGPVYETSENLAMPNLTYDVYAIQGQGVGGSYRSFRTDVGAIYDDQVKSPVRSLTLGGEIGAGSGFELGGPFQFGWGKSEQGAWQEDNEWFDHYKFVGKDGKPLDYEPVYQKVHGEMTTVAMNELEHIDGFGPVMAPLEEFRTEGRALHRPKKEQFGLTSLVSKSNSNFKNERLNAERLQRNTGIQETKNEDIEGYVGEGIRELFNMKTFNWDEDLYTDPSHSLSRNDDVRKGHHTGAITTTTPAGMRYVYGLPAVNKKQKEVTFSVPEPGVNQSDCHPKLGVDYAHNVAFDAGEIDYKQDGTHKIYSSKETPAYAYAYLLTSVLGSDYVDVDQNGPSDNDLGFWVKFDYQKYADDFKWRAPFHGVMHNQGLKTDSRDNTASYTYGEKEVWYMARAETKTHIAIFEMEERKDGFEAQKEFNGMEFGDASPFIGSKSGLKLKKIRLYAKSEFDQNATPLQEIHFEYDYSLCGNVQNNSGDNSSGDNVNKGKLTLKKLWITYQGSNRGSLHPYEFTYGNNDAALNQDYDEFVMDRWGNYLSNQGKCYTVDNPYVPQTGSEVVRNQDVAMWSMTSIKLPAGGTIQVDYESDRYAHVQNRTATQMVNIKGGYVTGQTGVADPRLYAGNFDIENAEHRRIYFDFESPIPDNGPGNIGLTVFNQYVKGLEREGKYQLYFKNYTNLRDAQWDYNSGYVELEENPSMCGVLPSSAISTAEGTSYLSGYVTIKPYKKKKGDKNFKYHPMAMSAWQYMRTTNPDLLYEPGFLSNPVGQSQAQQVQRAIAFATMTPAIIKTFRNYRNHCQDNGYGRNIDLTKSFIRLCSPDNEKYGGGIRVKQISVTDHWDSSTSTSEPSNTYGTVYSYETEDENGNTISSGVAAYEPMIGGDENPMRYAKFYPQKIPFKVNNQLFHEYPSNESYMPAPVVGYSKVTVKSLATQDAEQAGSSKPLTGVSVHEFYTSKDYPVLSKETEIDNRPNHILIPTILIGQIKLDNITASQGYSIELNNMHGKPKANYQYGFADDRSLDVQNPVSSVVYEYQHDKIDYQGGQVNQLNNKVTTVKEEANLCKNSGNPNPQTEERLMGVEYEFFTDQRYKKTVNRSAGADLSLNVSGYPVITGFPHYNEVGGTLKTVTTNKIVYRSGILSKVVASDGQSVVETENLVYDALTGRPALNRVTNNFEDPIYTYNMPAHWFYEGMGGSYQNTGISFTESGTELTSTNNNRRMLLSTSRTNELAPYLIEGDKFLLTEEYVFGERHYTITFQGIHEGQAVFSMSGLIALEGSSTYRFELHRSGARNNLNATAGTIVSLTNPLINRYESSCGSGGASASPPIPGGNCNLKTIKLDGVLHADATVYQDNWFMDQMDLKLNDNNVDPFITEDPYNRGERGIWAPRYSYLYKTERKQSDPVKLKEDGEYAYFDFFNWNRIASENCSEWYRVNEITQYSPYGYELENKDILDNYSSALYGYNGSVTTAVAANAKHQEIGFEGFEDYASSNISNQRYLSSGNLDFYSEHDVNTDLDVYESYDIVEVSGSNNLGISAEVTLDRPMAAYTGLIKVQYTQNGENDGDPLKRNLQTVVGTQGGSPDEVYIQNGPDYFAAEDGCSGKVFIPRYWKPQIASNYSLVISDDKAHSGTKSLKIQGTSKFMQNRLVLEAGKTYMFSAWVAKDNERVPAYSNVSVQAAFYDRNATSALHSTAAFEPAGNVIDGWQKLEFEFTPPADMPYCELIFNTGSDVVYVDDVRVYPKLGNMQTYVYDPTTLRLKATLDQNNYGTYYSYDEEGALYQTKVETAEGKQTLMEARASLKKQ